LFEHLVCQSLCEVNIFAVIGFEVGRLTELLGVGEVLCAVITARATPCGSRDIAIEPNA
jgi:hypothetical protein